MKFYLKGKAVTTEEPPTFQRLPYVHITDDFGLALRIVMTLKRISVLVALTPLFPFCNKCEKQGALPIAGVKATQNQVAIILSGRINWRQ